MYMRPLNDRVIVKRDTAETQIGSIIVPEKAQESSFFGTVVAVGPGKRSEKTGQRVPLDTKVGDRVCFGKYVDYDEHGLTIIMEGDIRFIVEA